MTLYETIIESGARPHTFAEHAINQVFKNTKTDPLLPNLIESLIDEFEPIVEKIIQEVIADYNENEPTEQEIKGILTEIYNKTSDAAEEQRRIYDEQYLPFQKHLTEKLIETSERLAQSREEQERLSAENSQLTNTIQKLKTDSSHAKNEISEIDELESRLNANLNLIANDNATIQELTTQLATNTQQIETLIAAEKQATIRIADLEREADDEAQTQAPLLDFANQTRTESSQIQKLHDNINAIKQKKKTPETEAIQRIESIQINQQTIKKTTQRETAVLAEPFAAKTKKPERPAPQRTLNANAVTELAPDISAEDLLQDTHTSSPALQDHLRQTAILFAERINQANHELNEITADYQQLENQNVELTTEAQFQEDTTQYISEQRKIKIEISKKLEETGLESQRLSEEISAATIENKKLATAFTNQKRSTLEKLTEIQELDQELKILKETTPLLQKIKILTLEAQVTELDQQLNKTTRNLASEIDNVAKAQQATEEMQSRLSAATENAEELRAKADDLDRQHIIDLAQLGADNEKLNARHTQLTDELRDELTQAEEKIGVINTELETQTKQLKTSEENITKLTVALSTIKQSNETLIQNNSEYLNVNKALKDQLKDQKEIAQKATQDLSRVTTSVTELQATYMQLEEKTAAIDADNRLLLEKISSLERTVEELRQELENAKENLAQEKINFTEAKDQLRSQLTTKQAELAAEKSENVETKNTLRLNIDALTNELKELTSGANVKIASLEEALEDKETQYNAALQREEAAAIEIAELSTRAKELTNDLASANTKLITVTTRALTAEQASKTMAEQLSAAELKSTDLALKIIDLSVTHARAIAQEQADKATLITKHADAMQILQLELTTANLEVISIRDQLTAQTIELTESQRITAELTHQLPELRRHNTELQHLLEISTFKNAELNTKLAQQVQLLSESETSLQQVTNKLKNVTDQNRILDIEATTLRESNSTLRARVGVLEQSVSDLQNDLSSARRKVDSQIIEIEDARAETAQTRTLLAKAKDTITQLNLDARTVQQQHEEELTLLRAQGAQITAELIDNHEKAMAPLLQKLREAETKTAALEDQLRNAEEVARIKTLRVDELTDDVSSLEAQLRASTDENRQLNEDVRTLRHQAEINAPALQNALAQLAVKERESLNLKTVINDQKTQIQQTSANLTLAIDDAEQARTETTATKELLTKSQQEVARLSEALMTLERTHQENILHLQTENSGRIRAQHAAHLAQVDDLTTKLQKAQADNSNIQRTLELQAQNLSSRELEIRALRDEMALLRGENATLRDRAGSADSTNADLDRQLNHQHQIAERASSELNHTLEELSELKKENRYLSTRVEELLDENQSIIDHFQAREKDIHADYLLKDFRTRVDKATTVLHEKAKDLGPKELRIKIEKHEILINALSEQWDMLKPVSQEKQRHFDHLSQQWEEIHAELLALEQTAKQTPKVPAVTIPPAANAASIEHDHADEGVVIPLVQPAKAGTPIAKKSYPDIFRESAGGMQHKFTDTLIPRGSNFFGGLPVTINPGHQTGTLSASFDTPRPTSYIGERLVDGDTIRSVTVFRTEDITAADGSVTAEPVSGILKQDHTGKVTDVTTANLTAPEKEQMALKQAKMLLTNCNMAGMAKPAIVIRGSTEEDSKQAARVWAALLVLKKDNPSFANITIKAVVPGHPVAGPTVDSNAPVTADAQAQADEAFISQQLSSVDRVKEGKAEGLGLQEFTGAKDEHKKKFDDLKQRFKELKKPPVDEAKQAELEKVQSELNELATEAESIKDNKNFGK